jgi:hypothetical protein
MVRAGADSRRRQALRSRPTSCPPSSTWRRDSGDGAGDVSPGAARESDHRVPSSRRPSHHGGAAAASTITDGEWTLIYRGALRPSRAAESHRGLHPPPGSGHLRSRRWAGLPPAHRPGQLRTSSPRTGMLPRGCTPSTYMLESLGTAEASENRTCSPVLGCSSQDWCVASSDSPCQLQARAGLLRAGRPAKPARRRAGRRGGPAPE